jgi:hypothetical protein
MKTFYAKRISPFPKEREWVLYGWRGYDFSPKMTFFLFIRFLFPTLFYAESSINLALTIKGEQIALCIRNRSFHSLIFGICWRHAFRNLYLVHSRTSRTRAVNHEGYGSCEIAVIRFWLITQTFYNGLRSRIIKDQFLIKFWILKNNQFEGHYMEIQWVYHAILWISEKRILMDKWSD